MRVPSGNLDAVAARRLLEERHGAAPILDAAVREASARAQADGRHLSARTQRKLLWKARKAWWASNAAAEARRQFPAVVVQLARDRILEERRAVLQRREQARAERAQRATTPAGRIRADLMRAGRVARQLGFDVTSSHDRQGRVSSYYVSECPVRCAIEGRYPRRLRISDHDIPDTQTRMDRMEQRGQYFFDGSADIYASANPRRRPE